MQDDIDGKLAVSSSSRNFILQPGERADPNTFLKKSVHQNAMFHITSSRVFLFNIISRPLVGNNFLCGCLNLRKLIPT